MDMNGMHKTVGFWLKKVGLHRGSPRLWFDSIRVASAGMIPGGRFDVVAMSAATRSAARSEMVGVFR
jgi:DNA (cytosine-5)-methyltransferase 1